MSPAPAHILLSRWMVLSAALYALGLVSYATAPDLSMVTFNRMTALAGLQETPPSSERFWLALAVAMMVMLVTSAVMVARDPVRHLDLCVPVFLSKFTGSLMGLAAFGLHAHYGSYLLIGLSDAPMGVITLVLWRRASAAR